MRGLAILIVLALHITSEAPQPNALYPLLSWGWMGVDLFFALSGFLITGILLDTVGKPGYFRTFYTRRVLRIWPAYLTALIILTGIAFVAGEPGAKFLAAKPWYWFHATNILAARTARFDSTPLGTSHFWSLAVEEQFYLLWPLLIYLVAKTPKRALIVSSMLIVLAPVLRFVLFRRGVDPLALYVLMPTRIDSLAWGALVAGAIRLNRRLVWSWAPVLMVVGALGLAALTYRLRGVYALSPSFFTIGYSLVGMASAGLVAYGASVRETWLTQRPLRQAGKYSYAMYIWHLPILHGLAQLDLPFSVFALAAVVLTIVAARVSWMLIEQPALAFRESRHVEVAHQKYSA